jgi:FtsP/CotA-like multicopper oxidase with cupredoxin domain
MAFAMRPRGALASTKGGQSGGRASAPRRFGAVAFAVAVALGGCGSSSRTSVPLDRWISYQVRNKRVTLTLVPGATNGFNGFNFNGYGRGEVLVQVPRGWRVTVDCVNNVSSSRHSCAIVRDAGNATAPIFPGASSPDPQRGLAPGRSAQFTFVASHPGAYRIACLVPNHELMGMWDAFEINTARQPSVERLRRYPGNP